MRVTPVRKLFDTPSTTAVMEGDVEPVLGIKQRIARAYGQQMALRAKLRDADKEIEDLRRELSCVVFGLQAGATYRMRLADGSDVDGILEPRSSDPLDSWQLRPVSAQGKPSKRVHIIRNVESLSRLEQDDSAGAA